jgi:MATE family multidrug resistance protein
LFESPGADWPVIAGMIRTLLIFIAIYALCDSVCMVFSFALRGAGDTLFVTMVSIGMAWPVMVLPTYLALEYGWGMYWSFGFATVYILAMTALFLLRFRHGKWKTMRVIEQAPPPPDAATDEGEPEPAVAESA